MNNSRMTSAAAVAAAALAAASLAGCATKEKDQGGQAAAGSSDITVKATDTTCELSKSEANT
ncbi:MAG: hypothetical protein QOH57_4841, partial [Mycobacterium sp.]|nr:hypothetical protein [Mycobacterium sp.]